MLTGTVMITGGAGFLGRGIMRKARAEGWDCKFLIVSRDEMKHFKAKKEYPQAKYVVCDILDAQRLTLLMSGVDYVIHAAAQKHIPVSEYQASEAIRINLDGTRCVIDAAYEAGVSRVVCISTDKAVDPVNTYGATKMLVERLVFESADFPHPSGTVLTAARYGNIIGSTGSVWSVFAEQAKRDGQLSVTNPTMTRFYWGINEAVDLIVRAASDDVPPGTVLLPTIKAIQLEDLAAYLTDLWQLKHYKIVGPRPGEKVHECMLSLPECDRAQLISLVPRHYTLLYGPTKKTNTQYPSIPLTSDLAGVLSPEDFVAMALDSETV